MYNHTILSGQPFDLKHSSYLPVAVYEYCAAVRSFQDSAMLLPVLLEFHGSEVY